MVKCYNTLKNVIQYRGAEPIMKTLTDRELIDATTVNGFVTLESIRAESVDGRPAEYFIMVLLTPTMTRGVKSAFFKKVFTLVTRNLVGISTGSARGLPARFEVILDPGVKTKAMAGMQFEPVFLPYNLFVTDITQHVMAAKYSIVSAADIELHLTRRYILPRHLPIILATDPICIYYDYQPGMIIRVIRLSETTGRAEEYVLVR